MWTAFLLFIIPSSYSPSVVQCEDDKRLLFNDQESVQSLLHQYEDQLNKYGNALQQVENKVSLLESENAKLRVENSNMNASLTKFQKVLEANNQSAVVTYVRWGRTICPSDPPTVLVYKGITGGSFYDHTGSGVDALCLPHNPDNGVNVNSVSLHDGRVASLYGSEYQYNYKKIRRDDDVPCAVCLVKKATSVLMMPAKSSCPQDWKKQYSGILVATYDNYKASSEYTCMDDDPEYIEGTRSQNDDGKLFDPVKTVCGSLPCPPYSNGAFVECAVCTR